MMTLSKKRSIKLFLIILISLIFVDCKKDDIIFNTMSSSSLKIEFFDYQQAVSLLENKNDFEYIPFAETILDESAVKYITINYEKEKLEICLNHRGKLLIEIYSKENLGKIAGVFFNKKIIGYTVFNSIINTTSIIFTINSDDSLFPY